MIELALIAGGAIGSAVAGGVAGYLLAPKSPDKSPFKEVEDVEEGEAFTLSKVDVAEDGLLETWRSKKARKKALSDGVVRWHLIGSAFSEPIYVKPKRKEGGSIPELKKGGETYLFPEQSAVPSKEEGVPVVIHREGKAEPINLRDSWEESIDAASLTQYLTQRVTSKKPSEGLGLGGLFGDDWDSMKILRYGILGLVGIAIIIEVIGDGIW